MNKKEMKEQNEAIFGHEMCENGVTTKVKHTYQNILERYCTFLGLEIRFHEYNNLDKEHRKVLKKLSEKETVERIAHLNSESECNENIDTGEHDDYGDRDSE